MVMVAVSPAVSPSVVAATLMIQKPTVTAGTLLSTAPLAAPGTLVGLDAIHECDAGTDKWEELRALKPDATGFVPCPGACTPSRAPSCGTSLPLSRARCC